jgi:hypothetical protein
MALRLYFFFFFSNNEEKHFGIFFFEYFLLRDRFRSKILFFFSSMQVPIVSRVPESSPSPEVGQIVKNRIEQVLAQLSLQNIKDQFPVSTASISTSKGERVTIEDGALSRIGDVVSALEPIHRKRKRAVGELEEMELPLARIAPSYFRLASRAKPKLLSRKLESRYIGKIFDITWPLSTENVRGTLYDVSVHSNATLHRIAVLDKEYGVPRDIPAVLKKSPIYDKRLWVAFNIAKKVSEQRRTGQPDPQLLQDYAILHQEYLLRIGKENIFRMDLSKLETIIKKIYRQLVREYNDMQNAVYVDAVGYYLGSLLVEYDLSPFYPLFYASFRAFDTGFFSGKIARLLKPGINRNFPVQVVVMQPLNGRIFDLYEQNYFYKKLFDQTIVDTEKVLAVLAQVVFGLDVGQEVFGIVNNDLHTGNLMFQNVSYEYLYYGDIAGERFWRIPTYGKVYKMIDFDRASFRFGDFQFGGREYEKVMKGGVNSNNFNNDLYRFVYQLARRLNFGSYLFGGYSTVPSYLSQLYTILSSILDCGGINVFQMIDRCGDPTYENLRKQVTDSFGSFDLEKCFSYLYNEWPYRTGSDCTNAVPKNNTHWFDKFRIRKEDIPFGEIVYVVF